MRRTGAILLEAKGLVRAFGRFNAVDGVDLEVTPGTITGLIGPNGAGKSTLFNLIAGALPPTAGVIRFEGADITGLPPNRIFTPRSRAHLPDPAAVSAHDGAGERHAGAVAPVRRAVLVELAGRPARRQRGTRDPRACRRGALLLRPRPEARRACGQSVRRPAEAARACPRDDDRPEADPARRARGRRQSGAASRP